MNTFTYKGYIGSIEADIQEKFLYGKLLFIKDLITYEAKTVANLEKEFQTSVDEYLHSCKQLKREPLKPFKGSLNVRIGAELHKEAALQAAMAEMTLNEFIKNAIKIYIEKNSTR